MSQEIISQFIDDELDLDDKMVFVEEVHGSKPFKEETLALLRQEKRLRVDPLERLPEWAPKKKPFRIRRWFRPLALAAAGAVAALLFVHFPVMPPKTPETPYRFVVYRPDAERVEITGSFTGWSAVPMIRVGESGYWERTIELPRGEYRFAYLVNGGQRLPDPTIQAREGDDFGGENTVLSIGGQAT